MSVNDDDIVMEPSNDAEADTGDDVGGADSSGGDSGGSSAVDNYADVPQGDVGSSSNVVSSVGEAASQAAHAAGNFVAPVTTAVSTAVGKVASFFHVPKAVVNTTLAAALALTGGSVAASIALYDDWVPEGKIDCKKVEEAQKKYGFGERDIPEEASGHAVGYATTWENTGDWMVAHINSGSIQREIVDAWVEHGKQEDEYKFSRIDDYYILAVQPITFGMTEDTAAEVGDWITFYFEDGVSFDAIVGDTKGNPEMFARDAVRDGGSVAHYSDEYTDWHPGPGGKDYNWERVVYGADGFGNGYKIAGWGHVQGDYSSPEEEKTRNAGINCTEFWGLDGVNNHYERIYEAQGESYTGQRLASFTNHGTADVVADKLAGMVDQSRLAQGGARKKGADQGANECKKDCPQTFDNSSAAMAALSFAYSRSPHDSDGAMGTEVWHEVYDKVIPEDGHAYPRSCDRCVCAAIRWSGTDDNFPPGATGGQETYLNGCVESGTWDLVGTYNAGSTSEWAAMKEKMQPGDVMLAAPNHISLFVGEELASQFEFKGDAAWQGQTKAETGAFSVSASLSDRAPGTGMDNVYGTVNVYRCVKPTGDASKYKEDGLVNAASLPGGCDGAKRAQAASLKEYSESLKTLKAKVEGWVKPLEEGTYMISGAFGDGHSGIDLGTGTSNPDVCAVGDGEVMLAYVCHCDDPGVECKCGGCGTCIAINHDNGMTSIYMHLSGIKPGITEGTRVKAGQTLGAVGTTGRSTGNHLHLTILNCPYKERGWSGWGVYMDASNRVNPASIFDF